MGDLNDCNSYCRFTLAHCVRPTVPDLEIQHEARPAMLRWREFPWQHWQSLNPRVDKRKGHITKCARTFSSLFFHQSPRGKFDTKTQKAQRNAQITLSTCTEDKHSQFTQSAASATTLLHKLHVFLCVSISAFIIYSVSSQDPVDDWSCVTNHARPHGYHEASRVFLVHKRTHTHTHTHLFKGFLL